jgi:hypothetical protein
MRWLLLILVLAPTFCWAHDDSGHKRPKDPKNDKSNIVGYRFDRNWWELGAHLDDVDLRGFKEAADDESGNLAYFDRSREVRFGGEDVEVSVGLIFKKDKLGMIIINVPSEEQTYRYFRKYYSGRLGGTDELERDEDRIVWADKDDDYLTVMRSHDENGDPSSLIIYARESIVQGSAEAEVPEWLQNVINSM